MKQNKKLRFVLIQILIQICIFNIAANNCDSANVENRQISKKEIALAFNEVVRYYESKSGFNLFSITNDDTADQDYVIIDQLNGEKVGFDDINTDYGIYCIMHTGASNPDVYFTICRNKKIDVFNTSSYELKCQALQYVFKLKEDGEINLTAGQLERICSMILNYNVDHYKLGLDIIFPSIKISVLNLHK